MLAGVTITDTFSTLLESDDQEADLSESNEKDIPEEAYLVEPLRSSVVTKSTGTLGSSGATDKLASTVLAFSHFVMEKTACLLALADLQADPAIGVPWRTLTVVKWPPMVTMAFVSNALHFLERTLMSITPSEWHGITRKSVKDSHGNADPRQIVCKVTNGPEKSTSVDFVGIHANSIVIYDAPEHLELRHQELQLVGAQVQCLALKHVNYGFNVSLMFFKGIGIDDDVV
ncbi:hypothetical protein B0H13DRAFT_2381760 [Mycena leptocephala]|nr:hypothetical protein B0H13DRAFT_2381760 [Mycena leptocephala]